VNLAPNRERAKFLGAGFCDDAVGHFLLQHQNEQRELLAYLKNPKQHGRCNAVRKISGKLDWLSREEFRRRKFQKITLNQVQLGIGTQVAEPQSLRQKSIHFDRPYLAGALEQPPSQKP
jgi:hypothetical protein